MKDADWKECIEGYSVTKISPDIARARSLIETADARIKLVREIGNENCNFVFEDYYTSLLEYLQALLLFKGYKASNHVCLGFYLRDIIKREELFYIFDDLRYKRNMLIYYGKKMDFDICKDAIENSKRLIKEIKKIENDILSNNKR